MVWVVYKRDYYSTPNVLHKAGEYRDVSQLAASRLLANDAVTVLPAGSKPERITGVRNADGSLSLVDTAGNPSRIGSHISAVCIGDSLTGRARANGIVTSSSGLGMWNWANWLIGAPFVFKQNMGLSGDVTRSILTRIAMVPSNTSVVFLMTGTNDVQNMSSGAIQGTIDSTYTSVSGYIGAGVAALVAAGKRVVISTIPPNNAFSSGSDSRIQLLDRLNAYIATLASGAVFVVDAFTALWDSAQPTLRVAKANTMHSDGIHIASTGALLIGKAAMVAAKAAVGTCLPDYDLYADFQPARQLYTGFRSGTGGDAAVKTAGTGTLADGWRSINNAGTATFTVSNANAYTPSTDFVGPYANAPAGIDEYFQEFNISSAASSDNPRLRLPGSTSIQSTNVFPDALLGGSEVFGEIEVWVKSAAALTTTLLDLRAYFTVGTSPADQAYLGTSFQAVQAGSVADSSSSVYAVPEGYRVVLRTPIMRIPENINATVTQSMDFSFDMIFNGAGSAVVWLARPRIWVRQTGYAG